MPVVPCPIRVTCPCTDSPVSNYSAEDPDARRFQSTRYWARRPKLGGTVGDHYIGLGCMSVCYSTESQQAANDCAQANAADCAVDGWEVPDPSNPNGRIPFIASRNTQQSCNFTCPDGTVYSFVQRVGTVFGWSTFMANFWAYALACKRARESKVCLSKSCEPICLNGALNCLVSANWNGTGGEWAISGLPAWATATVIGNDLYLNGTADTAGNTDVIAVFTTPDFSFATLSFQIKVLGITNAAALPNGTIGSAYSQQLVAAGGTAPYSFGYESGTLPAGVTVNAAGLISGTPSGSGDYTFNLYVRDAQGDSCFKDFTLTVSGVPAPTAYLNFEANVGGEIVDVVGAKNFIINVPGTFAAGKHDNGWTGGGIFGGAHNAEAVYYSGGDALGFTARVWVYMNAFGGSNAEDYINFTNNFRLNIDFNGVITFTVVRAAGTVQCVSALPSAGAWHHIMMYWDRANLKIGIKVNNGAAVEAAHNNTTVPFSTDNYVGSTNVLVAQIDEMAFWKNTILSAAQMTLDYNSGLGLFYPW